MRDPDRIDKVIDAVQEAWHANPDLRLTQLLYNAARGQGESSSAFYNTEDGDLVVLLEQYKNPL